MWHIFVSPRPWIRWSDCDQPDQLRWTTRLRRFASLPQIPLRVQEIIATLRLQPDCNPAPWDWAVLAGIGRDDDRQKFLRDMTMRGRLVASLSDYGSLGCHRFATSEPPLIRGDSQRRTEDTIVGTDDRNRGWDDRLLRLASVGVWATLGPHQGEKGRKTMRTDAIGPERRPPGNPVSGWLSA